MFCVFFINFGCGMRDRQFVFQRQNSMTSFIVTSLCVCVKSSWEHTKISELTLKVIVKLFNKIVCI